MIMAGDFRKGVTVEIDGPDLSVYLNGYALPEIASHDHKELPPK